MTSNGTQISIEELLVRVRELEAKADRRPRRSRRLGTRLALILTAGLAALSVTTSTFASIPDGSGVIHACYFTSSVPNNKQIAGELVVSNTAACPSGQVPVSFYSTSAHIPASSFTGVLPIANGGTGSSTQNFVDLSTNQTVGGTKIFKSTIIGNISGNAGTVTNGLYSTGSYADPTWLTSLDGSKVSGDITGNAAGFSGNLGGDVTGTQTSTVVGKLNGVPLASTTPTNGQVLQYDGATGEWTPQSPATGTTGTSSMYVRTIVVSPVISNGADDAVASGTALLNAVNGITGASAGNPYLVHLEPGVYDLNGQTLSMQPYVDIEGSGENVTTITSDVSSQSTDAPTVIGASNTDLRWLTVQNTGSQDSSAIFVRDASMETITHITAIGEAGIQTIGGSLAVQALTTPATGDWGVLTNDTAVTITDSSIGGGYSLSGGNGTTFRVADSLLNGGLQNAFGSTTFTCVDDYNASFSALSTSCQ